MIGITVRPTLIGTQQQIYRILPYREAILEGVLSSDIIGFQTYDYARHFLSTVESLLDANCSPQVRLDTAVPLRSTWFV